MTKAEKIARTPSEVIGKLKGEAGVKELQGYVRTLRSAYKRRVQAFKRRNIISHAQLALERDLPTEYKEKPVKQMSRNALILDFYRYANFFNAESSSIKGALKINREQDARIFGVDEKGKLRKTMTDSERTEFWDLYDDFKAAYPTLVGAPQSETVQQQLAVLVDNDDFKKKDLADKLKYAKRVLTKLQQKQNARRIPNVRSGRRSNFEG